MQEAAPTPELGNKGKTLHLSKMRSFRGRALKTETQTPRAGV